MQLKHRKKGVWRRREAPTTESHCPLEDHLGAGLWSEVGLSLIVV